MAKPLRKTDDTCRKLNLFHPPLLTGGYSVKLEVSMRLTESEYENLIEHFIFLEDKVEACYKQETKRILKALKEEYRKYVIKY